MTLEEYISTINQRFQSADATEHTYRGDLEQILKSILFNPINPRLSYPTKKK